MSELVLNVALVVPRTSVEGPGWRTAIWVQGCPLRCPGCCNPEMQAFAPRQAIAAQALADAALAAGVEGVTVLGGEPFTQARPLAAVAGRVRAAGLSVMVFSGYTLEELHDLPDAQALLTVTDLLVDGRYVEAERTTRRRFMGSDNQRLHHLTERHRGDPRLGGDNHVELRLDRGAVTLIGYPSQGRRTRP